jgi:transitional endoplasmic reticulum ATPase
LTTLADASDAVTDTSGASVTGVAARPAPGSDLGPNEASLEAAYRDAIGAGPGDVVALRSDTAKAWAVLRAQNDEDPERGDGSGFVVRLGRMLWGQLGVKPGQPVHVERSGPLPPATSVRITPPFSLTYSVHQRLLGRLNEQGTPLYTGSRVLAEVFAGGAGLLVRVDDVSPAPARLDESTEVELHKPDASVSQRQVGLADVGGSDAIISRLRELVELPLLRPGFYRRLGVRPPKGVLLYGPPGTGKTLICRALANELGVTSFKLSATELVGSAQGETEANLRLLFSKALGHAPSLVLIDEFDVIATHRERLASQSDVRAASQLLTLMDGLDELDGVVLVATTNRIQAIDPAFRRPGRFEEEVFVGPPDEEGRAEILAIHTREMPLSTSAQDAMDDVARASGGFVGADLMHLARSAGLAATRRLARATEGFEAADALEGAPLAIEREDFESALRIVRPSVLRDVVTRTEQIRWQQIVGMEPLKSRLLELARRTLGGTRTGGNQGILLHGAPGSGKSALVHALASELGANFVSIEGSRVFNQWLGESEEAVRALFRRARDARPSILLLDHVDALAPVRAGRTGERTDERVVSALLASIDDALAEGGVLVVGATSRPELIDPAVVRAGRLGDHLEVPAADPERRRALLAELARAEGVELDDDILEEMVEGLEGCTAADIVMLLREAVQRAAMGGCELSVDDLLDSLPHVAPH